MHFQGCPLIQTRFPGGHPRQYIIPGLYPAFPGVPPRATNKGTPNGVLLCFVNGVMFPGVAPPRFPGFHPALQTRGLLTESYYVLLMALCFPGLHPALQTRGLLTESYYVLLMALCFPGLYPALQTMGLLTESYYVLLMALCFPGFHPRATNKGTPNGVLLCFVNGVMFSRGSTPRYKQWDS
ncbi:hypothetical protein CLV42_103222 [Chitinophaga ginsengisoli]|uniref:Uncharacterized protein n=1 Tax=Chitinophaga ginsengisoli TaxID=363837 RepID=A0A2P8GH24_9BACT|nr:hypothetical protein CLV42_103222 [Chitinophaga ginsengisoli]